MALNPDASTYKFRLLSVLSLLSLFISYWTDSKRLRKAVSQPANYFNTNGREITQVIL